MPRLLGAIVVTTLILFTTTFSGTFQSSSGSPVAPIPWQMDGGDGGNTNYGPSCTLKDEPEIAWRYSDNYGFDQVVVGPDGMVYGCTGGIGDLHAINPDGTLKWQIDSDGDHLALMSNGDICVSSSSHLRLYDPEGEILWEKELDYDHNSVPIIGKDDTIYIERNGDLMALDEDGAVLWTYEFLESFTSRPAIDPNNIAYVAGDYLYAVEHNGQLKWKVEIPEGSFTWPVVAPDGMIILRNHAFYPNGTYRSGFFETDEESLPPPSVGPEGNYYFIKDRNTILAFEPDGSFRWEKNLGAGNLSGCSIGARGDIFLSTDEGTLYMIGKAGDVKWHIDTDSLNLMAPILGKDGNLFLLSHYDIISVTGDEYGSESGDGRIPMGEVICCTLALIVFPAAFFFIRRKGLGK